MVQISRCVPFSRISSFCLTRTRRQTKEHEFVIEYDAEEKMRLSSQQVSGSRRLATNLWRGGLDRSLCRAPGNKRETGRVFREKIG